VGISFWLVLVVGLLWLVVAGGGWWWLVVAGGGWWWLVCDWWVGVKSAGMSAGVGGWGA